MNSIILFLYLVPILAMLFLSVNFILAPHKPYKEKKTPFECGYHSFLGQSRKQFNLAFFGFALLFIVFDIELVIIYPWATSIHFNSTYGSFTAILFILILGLGFVFELGKNVLKIDTKQDQIYVISSVWDFKLLKTIYYYFWSIIFSLSVIILLAFWLKTFNVLLFGNYYFIALPFIGVINGVITYCFKLYYSGKTHDKKNIVRVAIWAFFIVSSVTVILFLLKNYIVVKDGALITIIGLGTFTVPHVLLSGTGQQLPTGTNPTANPGANAPVDQGGSVPMNNPNTNDPANLMARATGALGFIPPSLGEIKFCAIGNNIVVQIELEEQQRYYKKWQFSYITIDPNTGHEVSREGSYTLTTRNLNTENRFRSYETMRSRSADLLDLIRRGNTLEERQGIYSRNYELVQSMAQHCEKLEVNNRKLMVANLVRDLTLVGHYNRLDPSLRSTITIRAEILRLTRPEQ